MWARFASGSVTPGFGIRQSSAVLRGTTALHFRVKLGLEGSSGTVVAADPGFAALGSSGGQLHRLPLCVAVGVEEIVPGS